MRLVFSGAILLCLVSTVFLLTASARPFDRVPAGDQAYNYLAAVDDAGLLEELEPPSGELSRLEVAVLAQRGLANYGAMQIEGLPANTEAEAALNWLLAEFAAELAQIGSPVSAPQHATATSVGDLEQRISYLEEEAEEDIWEDEDNETYLEQLYGCYGEDCAEEEPDIDVSFYGDFYLQGRFDSISYTDPASENYESSDLGLYWGELGFDASDEAWSGHFSVLFDDMTDEVNTFEYYAHYDCPCSGWFLEAGRIVLPFGNNASYFPTYSATNDLGYTIATSLGFGYNVPGWGFNSWLFNPRVEVDDEEDHFTDYAVVWDITRRDADECQDGWALTAGYTSHIGEHDLRLANDNVVADRNDAINIFGRYDWGGNRYHLLADFTHTLDEFSVADLDADADCVGDQPCALTTEFVYEPCPDNLWGISLQKTCEMADYAKTRYGLLYGKRLSELAMLKLEYTHGDYGDFATYAQDADDTFVAEINLAF